MGTPKFHRKRGDVNSASPSSTIRQQQRPHSGGDKFDLRSLKGQIAAMSSPATSSTNSQGDLALSPDSPGYSGTPKRSWFATLFRFKPELVSYVSKHDLFETRRRIDRKLEMLHVSVQPSKDGISMKCKYDADGTMEVVKFRISVSLDATDVVTVSCSQQAGKKFMDGFTYQY
jgi:hypothetical protein